MSDELITTEQLPQYLIDRAKQGNATGMEGAQDFLTPPRLKICQASRKGEFLDYPEGTVLVTPTNDIVCGPEGYFAFTVLYRYEQFCVHNPYNRPDDMPLIRESTFDMDSDIAKRARDFDNNTAPFPEDPKEVIKYCVHYNSVIVIHGVPGLENRPIMQSLFIGEAKSGRKILDLLNARCASGLEVYCHNLMAHQVKRPKGKNTWQGIDISNPTADVDVGKYCSEAQIEMYSKLHEKYKADRDRLVVDYEDEVPQESEVISDTL